MKSATLNRCRGVGIIEVLIALVVVSFGVLGMAGLQLTGMKHVNGGYNRAKAVLLAENLAARMRANPPGVEAGHYDGYDSNDVGAGAAVDCQDKPDPYCQSYKSNNAENCSALQMAQFDLFSVACGNWSVGNKADDGKVTAVDGIRDGLNNGRLEVDCAVPCVGPPISYTVLISWDENSGVGNDESKDAAKRVQVRFNP